MKVAIRESTLTAIGDAIREKTDTTDLLAPGAMPAAIRSITTGEGGGSGDITVDPIELSNSHGYGCAGVLGGKYIELFGDSIITTSRIDSDRLFYANTASHIPFEINLLNCDFDEMFAYAENLREPPKLNNARPSTLNCMFRDCKNIRFPEDFGEDWDWSYLLELNVIDANAGKRGMLMNCYSIRKVPMGLFKYDTVHLNEENCAYRWAFDGCCSLDEVVDLPVLGNEEYYYTGNMFQSAFRNCGHLKEFTFATDDGNPYLRKWGNQTIDLSRYVGYCPNSYITSYNSGITEDKRVTYDDDYQRLKDDPDWFSNKVEYSRYNHDSAVNTINSLPMIDKEIQNNSLMPNIIKFNGASGSATDGGAISNLTSEEIAIAAAKGWTVSFT